ncbi:MAG: hypothetical protein F2529_00465 [Actinobacteria bacterium]|uniref:Unannotated protein n=1 Tax=freshwater metagenome TaxID=449393 RepID=A0A6J6B4C0_9ZZZZ|nr:hypothetical protein [Rhodoluna sp.]MSZ95316.1 hypothetical protein [Actinomycetota bacterium]MTA29364.1 hypothetical protein [Actinomycetota bacterium]
MNISSGGLAILVVGALWFLVLLPSFIRGDSAKESELEPQPSIRETVAAKLGPQAASALRAKRTRNFTTVLAIVALLVSALSWAEFFSSGSSLVLSIFSAVSSIGLAGLALRNHRNFRNLSAGSLKRDLPMTLTNNKSVEEAESKNENAFEPELVPNQNFLRTGSIEIVDLAEVISIDEVKGNSEIGNLDEILRRRRHFG